MQAVSVSLLLCLFTIAYGFPETKIAGGKVAPAGMFPYIVSLRKEGKHFCGGSIISSRFVLTAASCVKGLSESVQATVHAGTNLLNQEGDAYYIMIVTYHSGFNETSLINDIALVGIVGEIAFNNLVQPIPLATGGNTYEGSKCVLSGWGKIKGDGHGSSKLQYIDLLVQKQSECKQVHSNLQDTNICTFTKYGEGIFKGDAGNPLVVNGVQVGVVSYGRPSATRYPDVYTRVSSFESWVEKAKNTVSIGRNAEQEDVTTIFLKK